MRESSSKTTTISTLGIAAALLGIAAAASTCTKEGTEYPLQTTTSAGGSGGSTSSQSGGSGGTTATPSCTDSIQNHGESDVDCGGPCGKCGVGKQCKTAFDCASEICEAATSTCAANPCKDGVLNGTESDVDCGGTCAPCKDGKGCLIDADCLGGFCNTEATPAVCATPTCTDGLKNGPETDIDCGGACKACAPGKACVAPEDCDSGVCVGNACAPPSCIDMAKNGDETDVDCGGSCATKCGDGLLCKADTDCSGGYCNTEVSPAVCKSPACNDTVKNGTESDIDCGGSCAAKCAPGKACNGPNDCVSLVCTAGLCATPTCTDGVKNGTESDIDCGGNNVCPRCPLTQHCVSGSDCVSQTCTGTLCVCPSGMVTSPTIGGGAYCIDQKEVTYKLYLQFYTANPPTANQSAQCLWNVNYTPTGDWPALPGHDEEPVRYVNWCQAEAYCRFNNRRLCGAIGGGASPPGSFEDPAVSEWFGACSAQGVNAYPYGNTFQPTYCNSPFKVLDGGPTAPMNAGSNSFCQGGTPTLLDMSGNVAEWESSCSASVGSGDSCLVRGGSFQSSSQADLRCDSGGTAVTHPRNYAGPDVGFRCCL